MKKKLTTILTLLALIAGVQFVMAPQSSLIGQTYRILVRRGLAADLPTLAAGEFGFATDTRNLYIGSSVGNIRVHGDYITPEMYGAKGDGVTDDTAAVQAAIDYCLSTDYPKGLFLSGRYRLTSSVNIDRLVLQTYRDFNIFGAGGGAGFYVDSVINMFSSTLTDSEQPQSESINFRNVLFEGSDPESLGAHVLNGDKFLRIKFNGCRFFRIRLLYTERYIQTIYLENSTIRWVDGNFIDCRGATDVSFSGNMIEVVTGTVFKSVCSSGVWPELNGAYGFRFMNNLCEACEDIVILTDRLLGGTISGNYLEGNTGSTNFHLSVGTLPTAGANVSGNLFILTSAQASDSDYFPITWGPTIAAFSSGNFSNGRLHNTQDADGLVSSGDWPAVPAILVETIDTILPLSSIGNELITNPTFDANTTGWTALRGTLASVAGGQSGNCLEITYDGIGEVNSAAYQDIDVPPGEPFTISVYVKSGTSGNGAYWLVVYDRSLTTIIGEVAGTTSGSWVQVSDTLANPSNNNSVRVFLCKQNTDSGTMLFDEVSFKQQLPVAMADGIKICSADAGGVAGQAGPHFRTEGGGIFGMRSDTGTTLQYVYQKDNLADDGTVTLPDATSGMVLVSCNAEAGMWLVQANGTVTKISGSTNTAAADTDANLCVYDGGTGAIVKNRLGATGEIRIVYYYN
jgi:hypothetical protein